MNENKYLHNARKYKTGFEYIFDRNAYIKEITEHIYSTWADESPDDWDLALIRTIAAATLDNLKLPDVVFTLSSIAMYAASMIFQFYWLNPQWITAS